MGARPYIVPGIVLRVIDGDTISASLDLGWDITLAKASIRLAGLDCPERATAAGKAAAAFTAAMLPPGAPITVYSHGRDKYGRVLGAVDAAGRSLGLALLDAGHARVYDGGPRPADTALDSTSSAAWAGVHADLAADRLAALDRLTRALWASRHRVASAVNPAVDRELDDALMVGCVAVHGHPYPTGPLGPLA